MKKSKTIEYIDVDKINPDPNNPRKSYDEKQLKENAEAYKTHGQISPIEVDEKNMIISGELRWRTCKIAGIKEVACIRISGLNPETRLERQLVENLNRQDMKVSEYRPIVREMLEKLGKDLIRSGANQTGKRGGLRVENTKGYSELARRLGCSESWIRRITAMDSMPGFMQKAIENGDISLRAAEEIMQNAENNDEAKEVLGEAIENKWGKDLVEQHIKERHTPKVELTESESTPIFEGVEIFGEFEKALARLSMAISGFKANRQYIKLTKMEAMTSADATAELIVALIHHADELYKVAGKRLDVQKLMEEIER